MHSVFKEELFPYPVLITSKILRKILKKNAFHPFFQNSLLSSDFVQKNYFSMFMIPAQN